jgi:hypothetical protein
MLRIKDHWAAGVSASLRMLSSLKRQCGNKENKASSALNTATKAKAMTHYLISGNGVDAIESSIRFAGEITRAMLEIMRNRGATGR